VTFFLDCRAALRHASPPGSLGLLVANTLSDIQVSKGRAPKPAPPPAGVTYRVYVIIAATRSGGRAR